MPELEPHAHAAFDHYDLVAQQAGWHARAQSYSRTLGSAAASMTECGSAWQLARCAEPAAALAVEVPVAGLIVVESFERTGWRREQGLELHHAQGWVQQEEAAKALGLVDAKAARACTRASASGVVYERELGNERFGVASVCSTG